MQYAHSRCLVDELEALGAPAQLPTNMNWPEGFKDAYQAAKPGGSRPPEFDAIAQLGGDSPQRSYPLRNVGEINFKISFGENSDPIGDVTESQALRECYPGATYLHMGKAYEVKAWHTNTFQPYIRVKNTHQGRYTKPRIKTWINAGILDIDLMEKHLLLSESGFLSECQMQITEKVEGYTDGQNNYHEYKNLRQRDPNMRARQRNFRTSGVVLCIKEPWFKASAVKKRIADRILSIFCREYSLILQDIGVTATNISVRTPNGAGTRGDCIALFDQTYGSLRFTEQLYLQFKSILQRLRISAEIETPAEKKIWLDHINRIESIYDGFEQYTGSGSPNVEEIKPPNCMQVFSPGSIVWFKEGGAMGSDVEIVQPAWIEGGLMYQIKVPRGRRWVSVRDIEPSANADNWDYVWWNAEIDEYFDSSCENN